jgi:hypothetical protein
MGIKEHLDFSLRIHFDRVLKSNGFELVNSNIGGMGGIYYFKNNWLNFNLLNDRGIILTSISSIHSKKEFDFNVINVLLKEKTKPLKLVKHDYSTSLNLKQESSLFESNIELLKEMFNKENYKKTEFELNKLQKERAKLRYG